MHVGELEIDAELVRRLVTDQFPRLAELPITRVASTGTVNAIFRIGEHLSARLPRMQRWAADLDHEWRWLPRLAPHLSLPIPVPVWQGNPAPAYPFTWAIYDWIDGEPYADESVDDERNSARQLAEFVVELRRIDAGTDAPRAGRKPLRQLDTVTRSAIASARGIIDSDAASAAWEVALGAPAWQGSPVWIQTDLLRPNVLVHGGRLRAVIDFGGVGVGDPAADVVALECLRTGWSRRVPRRSGRRQRHLGTGTWFRTSPSDPDHSVLHRDEPGVCRAGQTHGRAVADHLS